MNELFAQGIATTDLAVPAVDLRPLYNAVVWQDRRGAPLCRRHFEIVRSQHVEGTSRTLKTPLTMGTVRFAVAILDVSPARKLFQRINMVPLKRVPSAR